MQAIRGIEERCLCYLAQAGLQRCKNNDSLVAAVPGLIDLLSLTDPSIKKIAITHMSINLVAVALFAANIWLRLGGASNTGTPLILSVIAISILAVSGWLGGEMVHRHGVGVDTTPRV